VIAINRHFDPAKPTYLLNSHHDTVKPNAQYTKDPFVPVIEGDKLYGLGSTDAGGCLVALIETFLHFYESASLNYNLVLAATAEEEISGCGGVESILPFLPRIDGAIVGEPTQMKMAVAERGLIVIDGVAEGKAGHAARNEGENAIQIAISDIQHLHAFRFDKVSPLLGVTKATITVIETDNKAHNIVPALCRFVMDVRVNELYSLEEVMEILQQVTKSKLHPRSLRLRSSVIADTHPLVQSGLTMSLPVFGSPTTSDKSLLPFPSLKIGPGDSARSHTANEFIFISEIEEGIDTYIQLLNGLL
jgi:acetylornithine deacetylase